MPVTTATEGIVLVAFKIRGDKRQGFGRIAPDKRLNQPRYYFVTRLMTNPIMGKNPNHRHRASAMDRPFQSRGNSLALAYQERSQEQDENYRVRQYEAASNFIWLKAKGKRHGEDNQQSNCRRQCEHHAGSNITKQMNRSPLANVTVRAAGRTKLADSNPN